MVTVVGVAIRQTKDDGREFVALIMQGGLCLVQSKKSGNFYATVKRCSIPSTFDAETAEKMVGEKVPGSIQRISCDPYDFTVKETGEIIRMNYRWGYVPEGATIEEAVFEGKPEVTLAQAF